MERNRVKRSFLKAALFIGSLMFCASWAPAQVADPSFPCDGAFYLVTSTSNGSKLQRLVRDTATGLVKAEAIPLSEPNIRLTCLGYSILDQHLYALDFDTYELLRINATGHVVRLGVPENLNTDDYQYYAGDVNPNGSGLVVVGREKTTGYDKIVYTINLTSPPYYAGSVAVVSNVPVRITDFATDPITGVRYGFDSRNRKLVTFGNGDVSTYQFNNVTSSAFSVFFDPSGQLFGYGDPAGGNSSNRFLRFNKNTGTVEREAWQGATGADSDGCSCPYTIQFTRIVKPEVVLPCNDISVEYEIINHTGTGRLGGNFTDLLPPVFTISRIEENTSTLSTMEAGPGGNLLQFSNFDMRLGRNILRLTARVEENAEGAYEMQASVDNLPPGLGETLLSDDPATAEGPDPNVVTVGESDAQPLDISTDFNCARDSVTLRVPISANSYQWSTGAGTPSIMVPAGGQYWVEAANDCFTFRDTVDINEVPEALGLDLGADRSLQLGDRLPLSFVTNGELPFEYRWSSSTGEGLNCADCPNPVFEALEDAVIALRISDAQGCTAEDALSITVDAVRQLYLPNAFSPNGDGLNDRFFPQGTNGTIDRFQIFNRWGALVFESSNGAVNDSANGWDGSVNGQPAEKGVYLFVFNLTFPDGKKETFSGQVMLLR